MKPSAVQARLRQKQKQQKCYHKVGAKQLPPLHEEEIIYGQQQGKWRAMHELPAPLVCRLRTKEAEMQQDFMF